MLCNSTSAGVFLVSDLRRRIALFISALWELNDLSVKFAFVAVSSSRPKAIILRGIGFAHIRGNTLTRLGSV